MWLIAVVLVALLYLYVSRRLSAIYRYAGGLALFGHIVVATVIIPNISYGWDIVEFHESAISILAGEISNNAMTVNSFATAQSLVYTLTDTDPVALSIVNGLFAILIPYSLRYVMMDLYPDLQTTQLATTVILFLPMPFLMLTIPMRDSFAVLAFATFVALLVRTFKGHSVWPMILGAPIWGMIYLVRTELALIVLVAAGAAVFVFSIDHFTQQTVSLPKIFLSTIPVAIFGFVLFATKYPFSTLQGKLSYRASGSAAYLESFQYESWLDVIVAAPARAIYFQFAPFPLHVEQIFHLLALLSLPILIVLTIAAAFSLYECKTDRVILVFLIVVYVSGVVGYGLIDSNFGTTARHRVPFVFLLVVFASPVLDQWWLKLRRTYDVFEDPSQN